MIEYVLFENKRIDIGASRFPFVDYFNIDSMSVLIGRNGSGKTRLLTGIAEALTSGPMYRDSIGTSYTDSNGIRVEQEFDHASSERGVIYYTSVPFRRKIRRARTLIDASALSTTLRDKAKMRLFKKIALELDPDINPSVTAFVAYPLSTVQRTLYETLLAPDVRLLDVDQNMNLEKIRTLKEAQAVALSSGHLPDMDAEAGSIERMRGELRAREGRLFAYLAEWADNSQADRLERLSWLAALTKKLPPKEAQATGTVRAVLDQLGLATVDKGLIDLTGFGRVSEMARETLSVLHYLTPVVLLHDDEREVSFQIEDDDLYGFLSQGKTAIEFRWESLSSGLLAIVEQFASLDIAIKRLREKGCKSALLLLDEPDAFLHLEWQRRFVDLLNNFLGDVKADFESVQVVLATHSPIIAADLPGTMVQSLDVGRRALKTFAAPIDDLVYQSFDSNSIGAYASKKIRELHRSALEKRLSDVDRELIAQIADEGLRRAILDTDDN